MHYRISDRLTQGGYFEPVENTSGGCQVSKLKRAAYIIRIRSRVQRFRGLPAFGVVQGFISAPRIPRWRRIVL